MEATIQKWGNSLAVRIPKSFADEVGLAAHSKVDISIEKSVLIITPRRCMKYRLDDLIEKVTEENIHTEIDTGTPVGQEQQ